MAGLLLVGLVAACDAGGTEATADRPDAAPDRAGIDALLDGLADSWNRDDLAAHVSGYDSTATWMTPRGPLRGRSTIEESLRSAFGTPEGLAGTLSFEEVDVRMLGADHALALGAFLVEDVRDTMDIRGRFTLVLQRAPDGWRILHDHSN